MLRARQVRVGRARFLRWLALATPLVAACSSRPSLPAPGPTRPAEPAKADPATPTAVAPAPAPAPQAPGKPTPEPNGVVAQAVAALRRPKSPARLSDRLVVLQNLDFHPDQNTFVRLLLQEWGKAQGWGLDVNTATAVQGNADLNQKLLTLVQAGTPPDLMDHSSDLRQQTQLGILAPVTDLMRELEGANGKANTGLARAASYDGQWWGVPYYERAGGWYVRNDWCKEVGVDPTRDLETIQGARDAAMKLSNPEKHRWGWGMTVNRSGDGETTVRTIGYAHGARIQDKDGLRVTIDTPAWAAAMEFLKETYSDPKWAKMLPPGIASWNDISNNEAFLAGTIGLTDNAGTMLAKAYFDKGPFAGDIGFVKRPRSDLGRGPVPQSGGGETIRFFKGSKNKDAAFDTIRHWLSPDAQRTIWTISPAYALPAYTNGWDDPLVRGNAVSTAYREIAFNEGWDSDYTPGPRTAAMGALLGGTFFTDMATDALRATKTTKQVVEDAHRRAVKVFQQFGLAGE